MPRISDSIHSVVNAELEYDEEDGEYKVSIPSTEVENGELTEGSTYRVAVISHTTRVTEPERTDSHASSGSNMNNAEPPVSEGERRVVTVESLGDQGDGIAKVERGYVVIVPGGKPGDKVPVEIDSVNDNVAFAQIVEERAAR